VKFSQLLAKIPRLLPCVSILQEPILIAFVPILSRVDKISQRWFAHEVAP
jgi:hypothetical protein